MPNNPLNYRNTTRRIADMTIREIEISMSTYIVDWANARIGDWWDFYYSENSNRLYVVSLFVNYIISINTSMTITALLKATFAAWTQTMYM